MKKVTRMLAALAAVATMTVSAVPVCAEEQPSDVASAEYTLPDDGIFAEGAEYHYLTNAQALIIDGEGSFTEKEYAALTEQLSPRTVIFGDNVIIPQNDSTMNEWLEKILSLSSSYAVYTHKNSKMSDNYKKMTEFMYDEAIAKGAEHYRANCVYYTHMLNRLDNDIDLYSEFDYDQVLVDKGNEMETYLKEKGIEKSIAKEMTSYYLYGLKNRIELGKEYPDEKEIANPDGTEVNERTTEYVSWKCLHTARCERDIINELNDDIEIYESELSQYLVKNGVSGNDSSVIKMMYIDGSKEALAFVGNMVQNAEPTIIPPKFYAEPSGRKETHVEIDSESSADEQAAKIDSEIYVLASEDYTVLGDVNGDGEVTLRDAVIIARKMANYQGEKLPDNADYNQDGKVNIKDAARILEDLQEKYPDNEELKNLKILKGDADFNGEVGLSDLVAVSKYNVNNAVFPFTNELAFINADMNDDDLVDGLDTQALVEFNLGKR